MHTATSMTDYHTRYMLRHIPAHLRGTAVGELIDRIKADAAIRGLQLLRNRKGYGRQTEIWYALHPIGVDDPVTAAQCDGQVVYLTAAEGTSARCAAYHALSALHAALLEISQ